MVKFGKNKFKALNRIAKSQKLASTTPITSNKILKKKLNADKKVSFQKHILLKESVIDNNSTLVKSVTAKDIVINELSKKTETKQKVKTNPEAQKPKIKSVEKHKKRHKTQLNDTKLLLSLMKNNK